MQRIQPALTELRAAFAALSQAAKVAAGCGTLIVACAFCSLGLLVAAPKGATTTPTTANAAVTQAVAHATATTRAPAATATAKSGPKVVLQLSGSGGKQTDVFHVGNTWDIAWTCQFPNDPIGNVPLYITPYSKDGTLDFGGEISANCNGTSSGDKSTNHTSGDYYLNINTGGDVNWTITVTDRS